jgi:hypothetical protein
MASPSHRPVCPADMTPARTGSCHRLHGPARSAGGPSARLGIGAS